MEEDQRKKVSLVFIPLPELGHLISMVELARYLLHHHNRHPHHRFSVTILNIPPFPPSPKISSYISSVAAESGDYDISFRHLPTMDPSLIESVESQPSFLSAVVNFHKPNLRSSIRDVLDSSPVAAVVVDMFYVDMIDVADEFGVPCYVFYTSSATMLGVMLNLPAIDAILPADKDMDELQDEGTTLRIPGFSSPFPPMAMPYPFLHRKGQKHMWFLHFAKRYAEVKGFIINSFLELQPYGFKALEAGEYLPNKSMPSTYSVGPLLSLNSKEQGGVGGQRHECLQWLDGQPERSVVFLCFGSKGYFSTAQVAELAVGLERSGHRFLWVLRGPPSEHLRGLSRLTTDADLDEVLPKGFLERTKDRGMVWPRLAPQVAILGHKALGGFVTHCGWNSVTESLWFGVPMLAWPLVAEQHLNAFEMTSDMGVALKLKIDMKAGNWATAEEIERGVRCLMDVDSVGGAEVRCKVLEMREKGKRALLEGGSSFLSIQKLLQALISSASSSSSSSS